MKTPRHTERSFASPRTFSDEHIERWALAYLQADLNRQLRARGISFETFLIAPESILAALAAPVRVAPPVGLLHAQRAVQARVDAERALDAIAERALARFRNARCANGTWIEPLHHRVWPRNQIRRTYINVNEEAGL